MLNLIGECHSLSCYALTAYVAIVFTRYTLLAWTGRCNTDLRTLGEIFFFLADEMEDITFGHVLHLILMAMFESMYKNFTFTEKQMDAFINDFCARTA